MLRRNVTVMLFFLLVPFLLFAQVKASKVTVQQRVVLTNPNYMPTAYDHSAKVRKVNTLAGTSIGLTTNYDYFTNTTLREQIIWWSGAKLANMIRPYPNVTGTATVRHIIFTQIDSATGTPSYIDVFGGQAGFPDIDVDRTDPQLVGTIGVVGHTPCRLGIFDGTSSFLVNQFAPNTDPSVQFAGPTIWLANSGTVGAGRNTTQFYSSTDGTTFSNFDSISAFSPSPIAFDHNAGIEPGLTKSFDETKVLYFGTNFANGDATNHAKNYNGVPVDSCDNFWALETTNNGTTWTGQTLLADGVIGTVANLPLYAPIVSNFGEVDAAITNDGTIHAVANGYGLIFNATHDTEVAAYFPVLYYNSTTGKWITISDVKVTQDTNQILGVTSGVGVAGFPTNSIGNAYPHVSLSPDGKFVFVIWTGPQITNNKIDTASDPTSGLTYYWRDLYSNYSTDGGTTWAGTSLLSGDKATSEAFGHAAKFLRLDPVQHKYVADITYLADLNTSVSLFVGNTATDDPIMYYAYTIPATATGVNDPGQVVHSFSLDQNYPNPFNPSTKINYSLPQKSNVSLKVYDMLGNEVANLVSGSQEAGQHNVNFNASKLASGVYFYTLKANDNIISKKMILMK